MKNIFEKNYERDIARMKINEELKANLAERLQLPVRETVFMRIRHVINALKVPAFGMAMIGVLVLVAQVTPKHGPSVFSTVVFGPRIDDWHYEGMDMYMEQKQAPSVISRALNLGANTLSGVAGFGGSGAMKSAAPMAMEDLGFSVGGAKGIGNFRENIAKGFMPQSSDLTYEGLFYEYFFDTGKSQPCQELFCPSYARAVAKSSTTDKEEYYLSVGLNSNIKESDFARPKTNFVVVLDVSGSMSSPFDQYYYDNFGNRIEAPSAESGKSKMQVANESLQALIDQLKPEDRLAIVLFSDGATTAKPLRLVGETDIESLKKHIAEIMPTNGTNMSAGLDEAHRVLADVPENEGYANRIIFMTDAMPNEGEFGAQGLKGLVQKNADDHIAMTFMGIGLDFQSELIENISKVRGANYLSIHSTEDFKTHLGDDFEYLVTPMVYDLKLDVQSSGFEIEKVYGSPDADISSGNIMNVRTLFPSKTKNGETRGGLVLLKLKKIGDEKNLTLKVSYEDTKGVKHTNESTANFSNVKTGVFENTGIRKGVLLTEYGELMQDWLCGGESAMGKSATGTVTKAAGDCPLAGGNQWERQSKPLQVSPKYQNLFTTFAQHLKTEMKAIGDKDLEQEVKVLEKLMKQTGPMPMPLDDWISR